MFVGCEAGVGVVPVPSDEGPPGLLASHIGGDVSVLSGRTSGSGLVSAYLNGVEHGCYNTDDWLETETRAYCCHLCTYLFEFCVDD